MSTNKYSKYVVENVVTGTQIRSIVPAGALDSAAVIDLIDSDYVAARAPAGANGFDSADVIGIVDSDYVQARVTLDGVGIDSATAQSIANSEILSTVDAAYVQARQTPQDFAYSSLTGAPTALSSFTNDTNYITAADIPATVDSDYVQARVTLNGVGLDSAGVTALVDSDYVAARAPAGETYSIDETGRNNTADWIQFIGSGVPSGQDQVFLKSRDTGNTWRGTAGQGGFQFDLLTPNQALVMEDGSTGVKLVGRQFETGGEEGLEIHGVSQTATNSTIRMITNNKTSVKVTDGSFELPSIPIADPANTDEVWADNGVLVMSGFTAPTGGGGLDSAAVAALVDSDYVGGRVPPVSSYRLSNYFSIPAVYAEVNDLALGNGAQVVDPSGGAGTMNSIAIGQSAETRGAQSISIGQNAITNSNFCTVVGANAGTNASSEMVCVGNNTNADAQSTSVGYDAGVGDGFSARNVALGYTAGKAGSTVNSVAIGNGAGSVGSGRNNSIAIGFLAGQSNQAANNIIVNATGSALNRTDQFGIDIRTSTAGSLTYDTTNDWTFGAGVTMTDLTASGVVIFSALPTSDPANAGQLWNDGGTLKVSAG